MVIQYGNTNNFISSYFRSINTRCQQVSYFDDIPPMVFDTYDQAKHYVEFLIYKAGKYAKECSDALVDVKDPTIRDAILDRTLDSIEEYTGVRNSVIEDFWFDMFTSDMKLKSEECNLDELTYEIIQYAIEE